MSSVNDRWNKLHFPPHISYHTTLFPLGREIFVCGSFEIKLYIPLFCWDSSEIERNELETGL